MACSFPMPSSGRAVVSLTSACSSEPVRFYLFIDDEDYFNLHSALPTRG